MEELLKLIERCLNEDLEISQKGFHIPDSELGLIFLSLYVNSTTLEAEVWVRSYGPINRFGNHTNIKYADFIFCREDSITGKLIELSKKYTSHFSKNE